MHISVSLTKKEFNELLTLVEIGEYIRDGVLDDRGEYTKRKEQTLVEKLYILAEKHNISGITTDVVHGMKLTGPTREREEETHMWIEEHDENEFWHTLTTKLSHRDFHRAMTPEDLTELNKTGWYPETLQKYIQKYDTEFESYGIERIEININAMVPSSVLQDE